MNLRSRLLSALAGLSMLFICGSLIPGHQGTESNPIKPPADLKYLAPGFDVRSIRTMPSPVTALLSVLESDGQGERVYIGTSGSGGVYRLYNTSYGVLLGTRVIAVGLGDHAENCRCDVNRLAVRDLDHDGINELIAETSQIMPRGRPRLYVWSSEPSPILHAFVRPAIESSWGHGMGFTVNGHGEPDSIISTYCGFGEIVEYRFTNSTGPEGFQDERIGWRVIGQLPNSGEGIDIADADNDGLLDLCVATGFAENKAAIHIYDSIEDGTIDDPKITIDEDQRFGTVKFLVGSVVPDGTQDLFVWWCAGLGDGHTEFFRYRLGQQGIVSREQIASGTSGEIWPIDGQMTIADMDQDGNREVWFTTSSGNLYRYAPADHSGLSLACQVSGGFGPIVSGGVQDLPCLYIGSRSTVLQFVPSAESQHPSGRTN